MSFMNGVLDKIYISFHKKKLVLLVLASLLRENYFKLDWWSWMVDGSFTKPLHAISLEHCIPCQAVCNRSR